MTQAKPTSAVFKASSRSAGILLGFALLGTAFLAAVFAMTHSIIERNEELAKLALVSETLPQASFDNDLIKDALKVPADKLLGTEEASLAYRAKLKDQFTAVVLEAVAPDGYSGKIKLLVGISADGKITGVRVVFHKETPGLGDYIEIGKSPWIRIFDGTSLETHAKKAWQVKKDGGRFDSVSGATITPRAIVKAVHKALQYFREHQTQLLQAGEPK